MCLTYRQRNQLWPYLLNRNFGKNCSTWAWPYLVERLSSPDLVLCSDQTDCMPYPSDPKQPGHRTSWPMVTNQQIQLPIEPQPKIRVPEAWPSLYCDAADFSQFARQAEARQVEAWPRRPGMRIRTNSGTRHCLNQSSAARQWKVMGDSWVLWRTPKNSMLQLLPD